MRIKDILILYLPQRIIIFPLHKYINILISRILNRLQEWNLLTNKKISGREKYFQFFLEKEINDIILEIKIVYNNLNIKIFTLLDIQKINNNKSFEEFILNYEELIKIINKKYKKICKKYFISKIPNNLTFSQTDKTFRNIKCGDPSGEEIEFLTRCLS